MRYLTALLGSFVILFPCLVPAAAAQTALTATAFTVTDVAGITVDLHDVTLDYTDYGFGAVLLSQLRELAGVRVFRGRAEVTVTWDKIKQITLNDGTGEITLLNGAPITAQFIGTPILRGHTGLGRYRVPFAKVGRMVVVGPSEYKDYAYRDVDVVVIDSTGTATQLRSVQAIDVALGEGTVAVQPWRVAALQLESVDQADGTTRGVMVLNDSVAKVPVVFRSDATLKGQSDLGPFEIRMSNVSRVTLTQRERH